MSDELDRFVYRALEKGLPRERIVAALREAGWPRDAVDKALAAYAEVDCPEPVPRPRGYASPSDTVLHLGVFVALYVWAGTWLWLLFLFVGAAYPDSVRPGDAEALRSSLRWAIAILAIAYPLYLWLSRLVQRALRADPERRRSRARGWLIWLTLFATAAALVGDLVTVVYRLLEGELTVRFLLKAAIVGTLAAGLLVHYRAALKTAGQAAASPATSWLGPAAALGLAASLVAAFWLAGSPMSARQAALDGRRVDDLRAIAAAADRHWREHGRLPESLAALAGERGAGRLDIHDPASERPYEYAAGDAGAYRLCAEFATAAEPRGERFWRHQAGRHCFELTAREGDRPRTGAPAAPRPESPRP